MSKKVTFEIEFCVKLTQKYVFPHRFLTLEQVFSLVITREIGKVLSCHTAVASRSLLFFISSHVTVQSIVIGTTSNFEIRFAYVLLKKVAYTRESE